MQFMARSGVAVWIEPVPRSRHAEQPDITPTALRRLRRDRMMADLLRLGYSPGEVGDAFGLHRTQVGRRAAAVESFLARARRA